MSRKSNVPLRRLSINLPESLVERIDNYALSVGIPRNIAINVLITARLEVLEQVDITKTANQNLSTFMSNPDALKLLSSGKSPEVGG